MTDGASQRWLASVAAVGVLLLVCFSTRAPWADPPVVAAGNGTPPMHVQPGDRVLGRLDGVVISNADPEDGGRWLQASGWAVSCVRDVPIESVTVLLDGRSAGPIERLLPRNDIVGAYGRADFKYSGWRFATQLERLPSGEHEVSVSVRLANGEAVDIPGRKAWAP